MVYPIALGMPSGAEWLIIAAIGLLLFGKRLPEVGRSLGKGIVEFKKGLKGVEDDATNGATPAAQQPAAPAQIAAQPAAPQIAAQPAAPAAVPQQAKFDPYTGKPLDQAAAAPAESSTPAQT